MWVLFHHDSSAAPQTVQTASPVCGTKNFSSVRLYSAPQLHRTIVAILRICPCGTPDQPQSLCPKLSPLLQSAYKPPSLKLGHGKRSAPPRGKPGQGWQVGVLKNDAQEALREPYLSRLSATTAGFYQSTVGNECLGQTFGIVGCALLRNSRHSRNRAAA